MKKKKLKKRIVQLEHELKVFKSKDRARKKETNHAIWHLLQSIK